MNCKQLFRPARLPYNRGNATSSLNGGNDPLCIPSFLAAHNIIRWFALIIGIVIVVLSFLGWFGKRMV